MNPLTSLVKQIDMIKNYDKNIKQKPKPTPNK